MAAAETDLGGSGSKANTWLPSNISVSRTWNRRPTQAHAIKTQPFGSWRILLASWAHSVVRLHLDVEFEGWFQQAITASHVSPHDMGRRPKNVAFDPNLQVFAASSSGHDFPVVAESQAMPSAARSGPPDLDIVSGFAFLSFDSLDSLESHIDINEAKTSSLSVQVPQKRSQVSTPAQRPRKRAKITRKYAKPKAKKPGRPTAEQGAQPPETLTLPKSPPTEIVARSAISDFKASSTSTTPEKSGAVQEISLLCSETIPDDEIRDVEVIPPVICSVPVALPPAAVKIDEQSHSPAADPAMPPEKHKEKKEDHDLCDQTSQTMFRIKKKKKKQMSNLVSQGKQLPSTVLPSDKIQCSRSGFGGDMNIRLAAATSSGNQMPPIHSTNERGMPELLALGSEVKDGYFDRELTILEENQWSSKAKKGKVEKIDWCSRSAGEHAIQKYRALKEDERELVESEMHGALGSGTVTPEGSDMDPDIREKDLSSVVKVEGTTPSESGSDEMATREFHFQSETFVIGCESSDGDPRDLEVDIETVDSTLTKNFIVVSGFKETSNSPVGHFSFHPHSTRSGTVDTSIQVYGNEIDVFLRCAMLQQGEIIKVITPDKDEFEGLDRYNASGLKAVRSLTERKRRTVLGQMFSRLKAEVFTDHVDRNLYFSKQTILTKAHATVEELVNEHQQLTDLKMQLNSINASLQERLKGELFGEGSSPHQTVNTEKLNSVLKELNIEVESDDGSEVVPHSAAAVHLQPTTTQMTQTAQTSSAARDEEMKRVFVAPVKTTATTAVTKTSSTVAASKPGSGSLPSTSASQLAVAPTCMTGASTWKVTIPSNRIVCNLSGLKAQKSVGNTGKFCLVTNVRPIMKGLERKNVMHIKIANDTLKQIDSGNSPEKQVMATAGPTNCTSASLAGAALVAVAQKVAPLANKTVVQPRTTQLSQAPGVHVADVSDQRGKGSVPASSSVTGTSQLMQGTPSTQNTGPAADEIGSEARMTQLIQSAGNQVAVTPGQSAPVSDATSGAESAAGMPQVMVGTAITSQGAMPATEETAAQPRMAKVIQSPSQQGPVIAEQTATAKPTNSTSAIGSMAGTPQVMLGTLIAQKVVIPKRGRPRTSRTVPPPQYQQPIKPKGQHQASSRPLRPILPQPPPVSATTDTLAGISTIVKTVNTPTVLQHLSLSHQSGSSSPIVSPKTQDGIRDKVTEPRESTKQKADPPPANYIDGLQGVVNKLPTGQQAVDKKIMVPSASPVPLQVKLGSVSSVPNSSNQVLSLSVVTSTTQSATVATTHPSLSGSTSLPSVKVIFGTISSLSAVQGGSSGQTMSNLSMSSQAAPPVPVHPGDPPSTLVIADPKAASEPPSWGANTISVANPSPLSSGTVLLPNSGRLPSAQAATLQAKFASIGQVLAPLPTQAQGSQQPKVLTATAVAATSGSPSAVQNRQVVVKLPSPSVQVPVSPSSSLAPHATPFHSTTTAVAATSESPSAVQNRQVVAKLPSPSVQVPVSPSSSLAPHATPFHSTTTAVAATSGSPSAVQNRQVVMKLPSPSVPVSPSSSLAPHAIPFHSTAGKPDILNLSPAIRQLAPTTAQASCILSTSATQYTSPGIQSGTAPNEANISHNAPAGKANPHVIQLPQVPPRSMHYSFHNAQVQLGTLPQGISVPSVVNVTSVPMVQANSNVIKQQLSQRFTPVERFSPPSTHVQQGMFTQGIAISTGEKDGSGILVGQATSKNVQFPSSPAPPTMQHQSPISQVQQDAFLKSIQSAAGVKVSLGIPMSKASPTVIQLSQAASPAMQYSLPSPQGHLSPIHAPGSLQVQPGAEIHSQEVMGMKPWISSHQVTAGDLLAQHSNPQVLSTNLNLIPDAIEVLNPLSQESGMDIRAPMPSLPQTLHGSTGNFPVSIGWSQDPQITPVSHSIIPKAGGTGTLAQAEDTSDSIPSAFVTRIPATDWRESVNIPYLVSDESAASDKTIDPNHTDVAVSQPVTLQPEGETTGMTSFGGRGSVGLTCQNGRVNPQSCHVPSSCDWHVMWLLGWPDVAVGRVGYLFWNWPKNLHWKLSDTGPSWPLNFCSDGRPLQNSFPSANPSSACYFVSWHS